MFFTASLHRRFPINFLLLGAFTAVEAVSLGMVSMLYDVEAVLYCTVLYCTVLYCTVLYCR